MDAPLIDDIDLSLRTIEKIFVLNMIRWKPDGNENLFVYIYIIDPGQSKFSFEERTGKININYN